MDKRSRAIYDCAVADCSPLQPRHCWVMRTHSFGVAILIYFEYRFCVLGYNLVPIMELHSFLVLIFWWHLSNRSELEPLVFVETLEPFLQPLSK